jgi:Fur family ferric uptake transcriptional regulator
MDSGLVTKHQFGKNIAQYEQAFGFVQHDHLICVKCHKVMEFCDPRVQQIQSTMGGLLKFNITHHSLNFYGTPNVENGKCSSCKKDIIENKEA